MSTITPDVFTANDKPIPPYHVLRVKIEQDSDCSNPLEDWDGAWTLVSFDLDYASSNRKDRRGRDDFRDDYGNLSIGLRRKLQVGLAFMLDRGYDEWRIDAHSTDLDSADGLLIWEHAPDDMGAKSYEDRRKDARAGLDEYNAWAVGDCWGYIVSDYYGDEQDSCWGYIGDYIEEVFPHEIVGAYLARHGERQVLYLSPKSYTALNGHKDAETLYVVVSGEGAYKVL